MMVKIVVAVVLITIVLFAIWTKFQDNHHLVVILHYNKLPLDVHYKFQDYLQELQELSAVDVLSWDESTKTIEYDDCNKVCAVRLKEDGFHEVKVIKG